jgi:hypothetical protein
MNNKRIFLIILLFTLHLTPYTLHVTCAQELFKNPCAGKPETFTYLSIDGKDSVVMTDSSKYVKDKNGRTLMVVTSKPADRRFSTAITMESVTMRPVSVTVTGNTEVVAEAKYSGSIAEIQYRGWKKRERKRLYVTVLTYDQRSLFWLLRGYNFSNPKEIEVDLIMPLGNRCSVKVRYLGKEEVTVPAGKFSAHKLEMEPNALLPMMSAKLKTYFWFSAEKVPRFLKYSYPTGRQKQTAELLK